MEVKSPPLHEHVHNRSQERFPGIMRLQARVIRVAAKIQKWQKKLTVKSHLAQVAPACNSWQRASTSWQLGPIVTTTADKKPQVKEDSTNAARGAFCLTGCQIYCDPQAR